MCREWLVNSFMRWLHFTLARKIYSPNGKLPSEDLWISWQIAASSSCEKSSVSFGFQCYRLLNSFCASPLRAQQASAGVAVVESPFYLKQMARDLAKTNSTWAEVMSSLCVKWSWLGDGRPGLIIPLILKHFFSTWWSHNTGLMHYKGHTGELR